MPAFTWSQSVAAGATYLPLDGWQYEFVPRGGRIDIYQRATAVGCVATITSGSDTLQEEAPIQAGGTAGVTPSALNTQPVSDFVAAGDRLKIRDRNTTAGAITIDGMIVYEAARR